MDATWEVRVSTKLFMVERYIKALHGGSIRNIKMCIGGAGWTEELVVKDMSKTLSEVGVATSTQHTILYDFDPVDDPLYKATLSSNY